MRERVGGIRENGFTLVEILVVIAILGILAAVVTFSIAGATTRGDQSACKAEVSIVNSATQAYYAEKRAYPGETSSPPDTSLSDLTDALHEAQLLAQTSAVPSATLQHSPSYDPTTGTYSASC